MSVHSYQESIVTAWACGRIGQASPRPIFIASKAGGAKLFCA
jgi:hypothetical protein